MVESPGEETRAGEWYVPKFGPQKFRLFIGMTFFPYTAMNASYAVIGSLLSPTSIYWDRVGAIVAVYLIAVGISAHALDAMGPNKPWGKLMSRRSFFGLAISSLAVAAVIGLFYAVTVAPLLLLVGLPEVFFLFAYNLELFGGFFHSRGWFCLSWGLLPVMAGYIIQTNSVGLAALAGGIFGFGSAYVEITASKSYKSIKRSTLASRSEYIRQYESILKGIVGSVLSIAVSLVAYRVFG